MMKFVLIAVAVAASMAIAWPLAAHVLGGGPNEATRLVEATERTNNKAEHLNDSFTDVIPPAPSAGYEPVTSPVPTAPGPAPTGPSGAPVAVAPGAPIDPNNPQPSPTPDKFAPYEHPSEHAVRDAIEYLNKLNSDPDIAPNRTEYIQAVEQLQHAWTPRYQRAVQEYKRFAYRIDHADSMARDYFEIQENLTSNIRNPQDRRRSQHIDAAEREVYLDWRDQAFRTLGQAQAIMSDLHDMNIIITKQSLSAHFAALYEDFHTIPPAITMLHEELARFRQESDRIQQTFGVQAN